MTEGDIIALPALILSILAPLLSALRKVNGSLVKLNTTMETQIKDGAKRDQRLDDHDQTLGSLNQTVAQHTILLQDQDNRIHSLEADHHQIHYRVDEK